MKKMMVTGGLAGFSVGTLGGLLTEGSSWPGILLRASISALVAGLLLRWLAGVFAHCLAQAHAERQSALAQAKAASPVPPPTR
ncbi:MAG TPA: hypothetical protein VEC99_10445 [Clostridia bacterium]|nr:hypothetical protein [Clostridia bacterium]